MLGWVGADGYLGKSYFEFKGATTPEAVSCVRRHWPHDHNVSRVDSCEDYDGSSVLGRLVSIIDLHRDPRVKRGLIASRDDDGGSTYYWGAKTSAAMVRCYEAGKMKERLHFQRPGWVRVELQLRPAKSVSKLAASHASPLDVWGFSGWTSKVAQAFSGVDVPRFVFDYTPPQFDRTTLYLARAFRRHFEEMKADFGDWDCVGREIEAIWSADDQAQEEARKAGDRRAA
jgi:hypothetical protein